MHNILYWSLSHVTHVNVINASFRIKKGFICNNELCPLNPYRVSIPLTRKCV